jgi:hypothetical protein
VCAVGALLAAGPDQAAVLEPLEHLVKQQLFRPARHQAGAKLRQDTEVEPRVGQLEPERVFPINAGAHGVGGLTVAELFEKLQDRHQGQPPRCQARLAAARIQRAEIRVLVKISKLVAQSCRQRAFGKRGPGHPNRLVRDLAYWRRMQAHDRALQPDPDQTTPPAV